ncbi:hypothetical protein FRC07_002678 [Ceratobasidium sp. 392]|nr:hypothetical protein FRC07_002678 [Ceratobasidium sp. 392]
MAEAIGRISGDEVRSLAEGVVTREARESRSSRDGNIDPSSPRPSIHQDGPIETRLSSVSTHPHPQLFYPEIGLGESHTPLRHVLRPEFIANLFGVTTPHASLNWSLTFSTTHIVVLSMLLGLASKPGSARPILGEADGLSTAEGKSQWEACQRPLGAWDVVWAVKAAVGMGMATWDYRFMTRPREIRARRPGERRWYFRNLRPRLVCRRKYPAL